MKKKQENQKRGRGSKKNSVQELLSIQYFTKYGLMTEHGEMVFFQIAPPIFLCYPMKILNGR